MDGSEIIRLLNTDHYAPVNLEQVNDLCRNYPMFSLAHALRVRIMEALGRDKETELRMAAVYSSDRGRLLQLVTEVKKTETEEVEEIPEEPEGIQFTDEPNEQADVIIEQHAPYAGPAPEGDLLELDDEPGSSPGGEGGQVEANQENREGESEAASDQLHTETLMEAVVKEETDMEEPDSEESETPLIDVVEKKSKTRTNETLINNFIKNEPGPIRADARSSLSGDVSLASIREHDGFITDTLAQIYVKQGRFAKAIYAYERLSLKYPEKSAYFAAQIEKIKNIT